MNKDEIAIARLKSFEPPEGYFVAFSGGKDSIVLLDLVKRAEVKYDAHFNFTTVDSPELLKFIRDNYPDVGIDRPETTMWKLIIKNGMPPTRIARFCCKFLKERSGAGRTVVTGIRWAESADRKKKRKMTESCFRDSRKRYLNPIIDWSSREIWHYILSRQMAYPNLYDEGHRRVGCIGCPMSGPKGQERDFKRWPKFKGAYLRTFEKMIEHRVARGLNPVWHTAQEVMDWWFEGQRKQKDCPGQILMFEDQ